MAKGKAHADQKADTRGGSWVGIPHAVVKSPAYRELSDRARSTLIEVTAAFNGYNNGKIAISVRQIAQRQGHQNYGSVSRALAELMKYGFIDLVADRHWKARMAREYRLTFVTTGLAHARVPATNEYLHHVPDLRTSGAEEG